MQQYEDAINQHYGPGNLETSVLAALQATGKNAEQLTLDDLAPLDQFHTAGKRATLELMHLAALHAGLEVLDVGGGLGGPARLMAAEKGCRVTVLDLTEEYCQIGEMLTAHTKLSDYVSFQQGSALDMPFPKARFDVVWTQHSSMNIADKALLFAEAHRVLRPGGRLALHEIMAGPVQPVRFPVPWARDSTLSFLSNPEEISTLLINTGFKKVSWIDTTPASITWYQQRSAPQESETAPIGLHLLLGSDFSEMFRNQIRNVQERRIAVIQAVFEQD